MTSPDPTRDQPRGAGVLWHAEVERVDLGEHGGRRLTARVEHRTLRVGLGQWFGARRGFSVTLGRRRAVAVEVRPAVALYDGSTPLNAGIAAGTDTGGSPQMAPHEVPMRTPRDPWARAARGVLAVGVACWATAWAVTRTRRRLERRVRPAQGDE